jgi:hypothetical protein
MKWDALASDKLRMLTKEEQMGSETTCTSNDTTEKKEALHGDGVEPKRVEAGGSALLTRSRIIYILC